MGTRGMYGFYQNGVTKATYNHFDSYPEWLGKKIVDFIRNTTIEEMNEIFDRIIMVDENDKPTAEQIAECITYYNDMVSTGSVDDWYSLLRNAQGDLNAYKNGLRYMIDNSDFIKYSLFCEWAYIINLNDNVLEIYKGFQKSPQYNRYYIEESDSGYYNCRLLVKFPLDNIPENWLEEVYCLTR